MPNWRWGLRAGVAIWLGWLAWIEPARLDQGPVLCLFRRLWDVECLGCGMSRALASLLRGDPAGAVHYNILSFVLLPLLVWLAAGGPGRRVESQVEKWIAKSYSAR